MTYERGWIRTDRGLFLDKGNRVFDVRHTDFAGGARVDGIKDDTAALIAAMAHASNEGGGTVYIPRGTLLVSSVIPGVSNVDIVGAGMGLTTIKLAATANFSSQGMIELDGGVSNVRIEDLTLDGNLAANPTSRTIGVKLLDCSDVVLVRVKGTGHSGSTAFGGSAGDAFYISGATDVHMWGCVGDGNVRQGMSVIAVLRLYVYGGRFINQTGNDPGAGLDLEPNSALEVIETVRFFGTEFRGNNGWAVAIPNPAQGTIRDVAFVDCPIHQGDGAAGAITVSNVSHDVAFDNCNIRGNVQLSSNSGAALILFDGGSISESRGNGVDITSTRRFRFRGVSVYRNARHGYSIGHVFGGDLDAEITGGVIVNNGTETSNTYDGISFTGHASHSNFRMLVDGVRIGNSTNLGGASATQRDGINGDGANVQNTRVVNNEFIGHLGSAIADINTSWKIRQNIGFVTEASGTASVAAGNTSVTVSHGLSSTPTLKDIQVTPSSNLGNASEWWVSGVTATQFTINVNVAPSTTTGDFAWSAAIY